jgi:hypothetical protein
LKSNKRLRYVACIKYSVRGHIYSVKGHIYWIRLPESLKSWRATRGSDTLPV